MGKKVINQEGRLHRQGGQGVQVRQERVPRLHPQTQPEALKEDKQPQTHPSTAEGSNVAIP